MPTPLEILIDPVSLMILAMYAALMIWETFFPGRSLPQIPGWKLRALVVFIFYFFFTSYLPLLWDNYLSQYQVLDLSDLNLAIQILTGVILYQFGIYVWHRAMHKNDTLWKVFHQMHHSAERLDTYGAFYFSPADMIGFTVLGSICLVLLVGISPKASSATLLILTFLSIFQHANIRTPVWLGYVIQRPESHTVHHAKGIHAYNYSDLPIFDIIFGTFKNPKSYEYDTGFYYGASERITEMLLFKDISNNE